MSKSTTVKTVDLNVAHTAGDPAVVQIHAHEFYVSQVGPGDHGATIHLDGPNGDGEPAEPGPFTSDDGQPFSTIYVVNEAAGEASKLQIVTRDGYCRRQEPTYRTVPAEAATSFDPERLSGALAATTTIADAAEASEEVDTAGATTLRVRARVSGTGRLDELSRTVDTDAESPRAITIDQAGDRAWVGGADAGNLIVELDISDPNNPTKLGTVSDALLEQVYGLAYDATNDVLIASRDTGSSTDLVVLDVSTPGSPSVSGSVSISSERPYYISLHESDELAAVCGDPGLTTSDVDLVDYSTPATPSVESSLGLVRAQGVAFDTDRGLLYVKQAGSASDEQLQVWTFADPTSPAMIASATLPDQSYDGFAFDADRQHIFIGKQASSDNLRVYDVTDRDEIKLRAEVTISTSLSNQFDTQFAVFRGPENILLAEGNNCLNFIDVEDLDAPKLVERVTGSDAIDLLPAVWEAPSGELVTWGVDSTDEAYVAYATTFGADELRIYVTNPGGSRSTTKTPTAVTLEDGREGSVDMDLAGEDTIEIEVAGRSGVQTTVDYVDVYRAT